MVDEKDAASVPKKEESVRQIVDDLVTEKVFHFTECRKGHASFQHFDGRLIKDIDYRELHSWMSKHIKLWVSLYEPAV
jgi:hypothetical protein